MGQALTFSEPQFSLKWHGGLPTSWKWNGSIYTWDNTSVFENIYVLKQTANLLHFNVIKL